MEDAAQALAVSPSRDAIAATIIEAMRARFGGADIELRFDDFHSEQGSLRDLSLSGAGEVRLAGGDAWLPIRYSALFDQYAGEIFASRVEFDTHGAHADATGVDRASLAALVDGQLAGEFQAQAPAFDLGELKLVARDAHVAGGTGRMHEAKIARALALLPYASEDTPFAPMPKRIESVLVQPRGLPMANRPNAQTVMDA